MIKEALDGAGMAPLAIAGLLLFVVVFCGITAWTLSRSRRQVATWSSLPLADGTEPVEPRLPIASRHEGSGGCGECENCTCADDEPASVVTIN